MQNPLSSIFESINLAIDFPNIQYLLKIFATLPLTTASAERLFSALSCVKSPYRSTMTEERLEGLLFMHPNPDITISHDEVIDIFAFILLVD